jgi:hypothetical protein
VQVRPASGGSDSADAAHNARLVHNQAWGAQMLNRANWKDVAELVGIGAIVLSLIFVGFQIKQSHEIAMAAQYQARLDTWVGVLGAYIQSDVALRVVGERARSSPLPDGIDQVKWKKWLDDTPVEEIGYHALSSTILLRTADNIYFQYQSGFLSEEAWLAFRVPSVRALSGDMSFMRLAYLRSKDEHRPAFRAEVERMIAEIDETSLPDE